MPPTVVCSDQGTAEQVMRFLILDIRVPLINTGEESPDRTMLLYSYPTLTYGHPYACGHIGGSENMSV